MENNNCSCSLGGKLSIILSVLALIIASAAYFFPKKAVSGQDTTFDERVKSVMIDTIKQNPQLLTDAIGEGIAKKREDTIKQLSADVLAQKDELAKQSLKFGNAEAKTSLICFFDPMCKHCIEFQKSMVKILKSKKDVGFKMLPVAVLGEDSVTLAKVYIAVYAKSPEKALTFIEKITAEATMDKSAIEKALKAAGLTYKDIEGSLSESDKKLANNGMAAEKLRVPVVPLIVLIKDGKASMIQATAVDPLIAAIEGTPETPAGKGKPVDAKAAGEAKTSADEKKDSAEKPDSTAKKEQKTEKED